MEKKSANVYSRIQPSLKSQAESILEQMGITPSEAINMFYRQIVLHQGLPFDLSVVRTPLDSSKMTASQLYSELEKGLRSYQAGDCMAAEESFTLLKRNLGIEAEHDEL